MHQVRFDIQIFILCGNLNHLNASLAGRQRVLILVESGKPEWIMGAATLFLFIYWTLLDLARYYLLGSNEKKCN